MKVYPNRIFLGKNFPFYVRRSTYIHVLIFLLTFVGGKIVIDQQERLREKNMELVQSSVRVDMVAMPKFTLNELKNLSSGQEAPEEKKPDPTAPVVEPAKVVVKEVEKVQEKIKDEPKSDPTPSFEEANKIKRESFLSKLKQIGNKKINTGSKQTVESGLHGEKSSELKNLVVAGNKLNKGTTIYGDSSAADLTAFQMYAAKLPDLVRPHWRLPSFLMDKKLKCRIRVWIALNGEVLRAEVYQSSLDSEYDQRAIEAVKSASPFPRLSEELAKRGQNGDIALGFPL